MKIKDENFFVTQGWMRTQLNLSGNALNIYAIIYGFCQTEDQKFTGSIQYLADWCGTSRQSVMNNLKKLVEDGLIIKEESVKNGVKFVSYEIDDPRSKNLTHPVKKFDPPGQKILPNNIDNNKKDNKVYNNRNFGSNSSFQLNNSAKRSKKESLYTKCEEEIFKFTENNQMRKLLKEYLSVRIKNEDKPLGISSWKGILKKLKTEFEEKEWGQVIRQSINRNYANVFPVSKSKKSDANYMEQLEGIPHDGRYDNENHTITGEAF